jgi:nitroreductase
LEAVRSGPSAINRQPWRFAVDGSKIHVYKTASDFASGIDIGIAIGNIEVLAIEERHPPAFSVESPAPPAYLGGTYVCSVSFRD